MQFLKTEKPAEERIWEKCFAPNQPEEPLIRVLKNIENGRFEGTFSMECDGVLSRAAAGRSCNPNEEIEDSPDLYRSFLSSCLSRSQRLDFVYSSGKGDKGNPLFSLKIAGHSVGETCDEAKDSTHRLWQNLAVVLNAMSNNYYFRPVKEREQLLECRNKHGYEEVIRPAGFSIEVEGRAQLGFSGEAAHGESSTRLFVSPFAQREIKLHFDSATAGMSGHSADMKILVSLRPMGLTIEEVDKVSAALKKLDGGNVNRLNSRDEPFGAVDDEGFINALRQNLSLWAMHPSGVCISCTVLSETRLPASLLAMIGDDIFGAFITISNRGNSHKDRELDAVIQRNAVERELLDLRGCVNNTALLPPLLPSTQALLKCGMKKVYQAEGVDLPDTGIVLGHVNRGAVARELRFARSDRSRHAYVIGATGTGKSTLLYQMIRQDIENGEGLCLLDPHGDLYSQLLRSIPKERVGDVILIDPCDFDHAVGINFFECGGKYKSIQMNFITNEMIKIFDRLYDLKQTGGPIFEQYMRNAMLLVMDNELQGATLMDIPLLFEDKAFRGFLKERCKSPAVVSFWNRQAETAGGDFSLVNVAPYITSKLNQFTNNALLRPIIGQPKSTIDFRQAMDSGKIILVNLSRGLLGELDSQLLGMLILGKIFSASMSRVNLRPEERRPMFVYIDEFQNFTTDSIAHMLSEARKFGLCLTLANQHMSQLSGASGRQNLCDAVIGNVSTILMMRMGAADAEKLEAYIKPGLTSQDLQELPDYHVAGRILNNNRACKPLVFRTLPASISDNSTDSDHIIQFSRYKYTTPVPRVEAEIESRRNVHKKEDDI